MKYKVMIALFGLLVAIAGNAQQAKKTDVEIAGLKGKVKSCLTENVTLVSKFGTWVEDARAPSSHALYDNKGNQTEVASYNVDGSLDSKTVYAYDSKGNGTESALYNADGSLGYFGTSRDSVTIFQCYLI